MEPGSQAALAPEQERVVSFAAKLNEEEARRALVGRPTWFSLLLPSAERRSKDLVHLELVRMPYALVTAATATTTLRCLVDRVHGEVSRLAPGTEIEEETRIDYLPSKLPLGQCSELGKRFLIRSLILLRSTSRTLSIHDCEACSYPVFVGYRQRQRGRLDIRVLDAVTGKSCGTGVKRAFLWSAAAAQSPA